MLVLKNCMRCGRVFNGEEPDELCPECVIEDGKDLKKVKDFLDKNPMANTIELHAGTGVTQKQILRFIKNGSLKIRGQAGGLKCRLCGKDINKGILCDNCRAKTEGAFDKRKNK